MNQKDFASLLTLSPCELEVFARYGEGKSTKEIAHELKVSVKTIDAQRASIQKKSGVRGAPAFYHFATRYAIFCEQNKMKLGPIPVTKPVAKLAFQPVK